MHGAGLVGGAGRALALASARTGAREKVQGQSPRGFVARRNSNGLFSQIRIFFPIAPVDFQSIGGGEGGGGEGSELFFPNFFFFCNFWGRGGGRGGEGDPETRGTSCAIPSWNVPKSIFWGGETEKVSPKVLLDQAIDEKVSPKISLNRKCHQKLCDLRNRESDQNLSVIKVAGNQKLCTNADFLLIKVQRLGRKLASKFFMDLF